MTVTLTNAPKNYLASGSGGNVFFGWLFWFTTSTPTSPLTSLPKNSGTLTNLSKH